MPELSAANVVRASEVIRADQSSRFPVHGIDALVGQTVTDLGATRSMIALTEPREWASVASTLTAMLARYPFRDSPRWSGERIILGALVNELQAYALAAGEPLGGPPDLRDPLTQAGEREALTRMTIHAA